jgi:hypothetical protein
VYNWGSEPIKNPNIVNIKPEVEYGYEDLQKKICFQILSGPLGMKQKRMFTLLHFDQRTFNVQLRILQLHV